MVVAEHGDILPHALNLRQLLLVSNRRGNVTVRRASASVMSARRDG